MQALASIYWHLTSRKKLSYIDRIKFIAGIAVLALHLDAPHLGNDTVEFFLA
jgi:hypothetical protein